MSVKQNNEKMESKKIVCPKCHGLLEVTNPKQEPELMIRCPNPACGARMRVRFETGETVLAPKGKKDDTLGYLSFGGHQYPLQEGRNTVGRSSSKHEATIELPTDDRSVSRLHCLLETVRTKTGKVKVIVSDLRTAEKIAVKPTLLSDEPLAAEDRLVLEDSDTLCVGSQTLYFHQ